MCTFKMLSDKKIIAAACLWNLCCVVFVPIGRSAADDNLVKGRGKPVPPFISVQHEKPKVRIVQTSKAFARSGPNDKYYQTSTLPKGSSVEVYLETSDGWSGIRPPANSHNWIPSSVAYLLPGGKSAEIIDDNTPAWIGSDLPDVPEFMWQTPLSKTQQVQILGEQSQLSEDGKKQLWYKIAPPQGEFRWVKSVLLSDNMPERDPADMEPMKLPSKSAMANPAMPKKATTKPSDVQLAAYQEAAPPLQGDAIPQDNMDGNVVWSDEQEVLAKVQQQIRSEQAEVQRDMVADGIPVEINEGHDTVDLDSHRTTKIRPIPSRAQSKKAKNTLHQTDAMQQWDAMQSNGAKRPQVGPLGSVLGLIGIGVVEADRAPVSATMSKQYHTNQPTGDLGRIGPVGASRLDRLPRPGQRVGPSMTLPPDAIGSGLGSPLTSNYIPEANNAPANGGAQQSTFSKWLNSREPLFAGNPNQPTYAAPNNPVSNPNIGTTPNFAQTTASTGISQDPREWHGLSTNRTNINGAIKPVEPAIVYDQDDDVKEFQTPEVQSALVQLTREVAGPTENWNLLAIRNQASKWIESGPNAMVRGEARLLMDRVDRFESLRQRTIGFAQNTASLAQQPIRNGSFENAYTGGANAQPGSQVVTASASNMASDPATVSNGIAMTSGQAGDASGWLVQVHTSYPGQPEFALTDDAGNVITYVQSTPGLNLRRYLQQPVTVYGLRGYVPNLASKQIVAERVVRVR